MNEIFVGCLGGIFIAIFTWAFKTLPQENWQILATIPKEKQSAGDYEWKGENLTYYGLFNAFAYFFGVAMVLILLGSISIPMPAILGITGLVLAVCIPCSSIIARIVEKKKYTFTVGGASFVGILLTPIILLLVNSLMPQSVPVMPALAAISIGYTFGEGLGRLACISFGCCYGKPLKDCPIWIRTLFEKMHFVFQGKTKKIAYAHGLDGEKVFPVQAITVILYASTGLTGVYLFLKGQYFTTYILTLVITQVWRIVSEFLRADYRGNGYISVYQKMSAIAVVYGCAILPILPHSPLLKADILKGITYLWNPTVILLLQGLWIAIFLRTGRSKVTGAFINFHVIRERL